MRIVMRTVLREKERRGDTLRFLINYVVVYCMYIAWKLKKYFISISCISFFLLFEELDRKTIPGLLLASFSSYCLFLFLCIYTFFIVSLSSS